MPVNDARQLAARWLATAEGDLIIARAAGRDDDAPPRGAAFFVQQALEKALKSILAWEQIDFPRVHDLDRLAGMLPMSWELAIPVGSSPASRTMGSRPDTPAEAMSTARQSRLPRWTTHWRSWRTWSPVSPPAWWHVA